MAGYVILVWNRTKSEGRARGWIWSEHDFRAATYEAGATGYGFAYVQSHCAGREVTQPMPNAITTLKGEKVATTE
jgi:hypothetical protein